jgi:hypothetical protein
MRLITNENNFALKPFESKAFGRREPSDGRTNNHDAVARFHDCFGLLALAS